MTAATEPGAVAARLASLLRPVPDFPRPGITFQDVTPLLADPRGLADAVAAVADLAPAGIDAVAGVEARGFVLGAPVALALGAGFVPVRKAGKLPWRTVRQSYALEYGEAVVEVHEDAVAPGARVLLIDDVLATGGTAAASAALLERVGADVVGLAFLVELAGLGGREVLAGRSVGTVVRV